MQTPDIIRQNERSGGDNIPTNKQKRDYTAGNSQSGEYMADRIRRNGHTHAAWATPALSASRAGRHLLRPCAT